MATKRKSPGPALFRRTGDVWWFRGTIAGKRIRVSLRTTIKDVAEQKVSAMVRNIGLREAGIETHGETKSVTVDTLVGEYLAAMKRKGLDAAYTANTGTKIRLLLKDAPTLATVTPEYVRRALARVADAPIPSRGSQEEARKPTPQTVNAHRVALSGFFNFLVREGRWATNPVKVVDGVKVVGPDLGRRSMSDEEIERLLAVVPSHRWTVYAFLIGTGLRRGEAETIVWSDVNLEATPEQGSVTVRARNAKSRKERTVFYDAVVVDALRASGGPGKPAELVFPSIPTVATFYADLAAAGVERETSEGALDIHALRVTFATRRLRAGVPLVQVQHDMGHSDPKLTANIYTRLSALDGAQAAAKAALPDVPRLCLPGRTSTHSGALSAGEGETGALGENDALACAGVQDGAGSLPCRSGGIGRRTRFRVQRTHKGSAQNPAQSRDLDARPRTESGACASFVPPTPDPGGSAALIERAAQLLAQSALAVDPRALVVKAQSLLATVAEACGAAPLPTVAGIPPAAPALEADPAPAPLLRKVAR